MVEMNIQWVKGDGTHLLFFHLAEPTPDGLILGVHFGGRGLNKPK
jgi:hypothetical protein